MPICNQLVTRRQGTDADGNAGTKRLGLTSAGAYSVRVPPGLYSVFYETNLPGANAPSNINARLGCLRVP